MEDFGGGYGAGNGAEVVEGIADVDDYEVGRKIGIQCVADAGQDV